MPNKVSFPKTPGFWVAIAVIVSGLALSTVSQMSLEATVPMVFVAVGYFTALLGAIALFGLWVRHRAR